MPFIYTSCAFSYFSTGAHTTSLLLQVIGVTGGGEPLGRETDVWAAFFTYGAKTNPRNIFHGEFGTRMWRLCVGDLLFSAPNFALQAA